MLATKKINDFYEYTDIGKQFGFRTAALSFIKSLFGETHIYYIDFNEFVKGYDVSATEKGVNILQSIRHEIDQDWLITIQQLISAEIFSDFLEMARHLLDLKYKDPSAVMIGSVLEEHLRQLCKNHNVDLAFLRGTDSIPKKAEVINADLVKANVYNVMVQKNITAWLDLRNKAAHGKYGEYAIENVELMYHGVVNFIATTN
ncbi:MAG: hypothetical protein ACK504_04420 [Bacteroidota bacterium]